VWLNRFGPTTDTFASPIQDDHSIDVRYDQLVECAIKLKEVTHGLPKHGLDLIMVRVPVLTQVDDCEALNDNARVIATNERTQEAPEVLESQMSSNARVSRLTSRASAANDL
jgi:hypothetical protein